MNVRSWRESPYAAAVLAAAIVSLATFALWHPVPVGSAQDDGLYVILGKALATGQGYRFINLPDAPQAVHYPPGYPALIALLWTMWPRFPANAVLFAVANVVLLGVAAAATLRLLRALDVTPVVAVAAVLAGFLMPPMLALSATLMSEPLWLALAVPWLLWADRVAVNDTTSRGRLALLGACAGGLTLIRTQSVVLVAGVVLVLLLRRRWTAAAIVGAAAVVVMLPWQLWVSRHASLIPAELSGKYGAYGVWVAEGVHVRGARIFTEAAWRNAGLSFALIRAMFSVVGIPGASVVFALALIPPAAAGAMRLARRAPVLLVSLCGHTALILLFPWDPQRYVWGSWPFIVVWLVAGFVELHSATRGTAPANARRRDTIRIAAGVSLALVVVGAVMSTLISVATGSFRNSANFGAQQLAPMVAWTNAYAATTAVVASDDDAAVYLYTGRRTVPLSVPLASRHGDPEPGPIALDMIMRRYRPDFVQARWRASVDAARRLSDGASPVLVPVARLSTGFVFARVLADSAR